jgi:hypothetical protein
LRHFVSFDAFTLEIRLSADSRCNRVYSRTGSALCAGIQPRRLFGSAA